MKTEITDGVWLHKDDWERMKAWYGTQETLMRQHMSELHNIVYQYPKQSIKKNNMADHKLFAPKLMKLEGGFVNHPNDPGGATMKGVTLNVYTSYRVGKGLPKPTVEDLKNITDEEWMDIFKKNYWDKLKADEIQNQSIAEIMVDWLYNSGVGMIKNIQKILNVTADGISGKNTINAINNFDQPTLFENVFNARKEFYETIIKKNPKLETFRKGWMNRLNEFKFIA